MNIRFETEVDGYYTAVMHRFDRRLFEALAPPLVPLEILNFTGSKTGDLVHLKFGGPIYTEWISKIIDHGCDEESAFFIDQGTKLPFPLKTWHHRHIVEKIAPNKSKIIDDIDFESYNPVLTALLYPLLYLSFKPRSKIYRDYFSTVSPSTV
jgi:ligand-binding SRPBCC domain-containing protein